MKGRWTYISNISLALSLSLYIQPRLYNFACLAKMDCLQQKILYTYMISKRAEMEIYPKTSIEEFNRNGDAPCLVNYTINKSQCLHVS